MSSLRREPYGAPFDDGLNQRELRAFTVADTRVHQAVEDLFDAEHDVGRTPIRTVGWPRTIREGVAAVD